MDLARSTCCIASDEALEKFEWEPDAPIYCLVCNKQVGNVSSHLMGALEYLDMGDEWNEWYCHDCFWDTLDGDLTSASHQRRN